MLLFWVIFLELSLEGYYKARDVLLVLFVIYYVLNFVYMFCFIEKLIANNVTLYSTGGTETFIRSLGHEVNAIEDTTGYPSILGGRVKTLHPKVFGGILGRRFLESDRSQMENYQILKS